MPKKKILNKVLQSFILKIITGLVVIGSTIFFVEWAGQAIQKALTLNAMFSYLLIAVVQAIVSVAIYKILFSAYEHRNIQELDPENFGKYSFMGFATGLILQTSFIIVIYLAGGYTIIRSNPFSTLVPAFSAALSAGFVAEILIRGVFFRILEDKFGTSITITVITILFGLIHSKAEGANPISVMGTAVQAGFLLSAAYVMTRSLWFTIFIHFAWDFAEPGIFGGINPGISLTESLFTSKITGPPFITGGVAGPQNSMTALVFCAALGSLFLWMAAQRGRFIYPYWKK